MRDDDLSRIGPHRFSMNSSVTSALHLLLQSDQLVDASGQRVSRLSGRPAMKALCLYFSAHWCPPCRGFTPRLTQAYSDYVASLQGRHPQVQVVFVSADRSLPDMLHYMKEAHGAWPAVPPTSPLQGLLSSAFAVQGIPAVIVVDTSGEILTRDGRSEVMSQGAAAFHAWQELCADMDTSVVQLLRDNEPDVTKDAANILIKLLANVLKDPSSLKYRSVRLANPIIESKLLVAAGAFETLFSVGFEEASDSLVLPYNVSLKKVEAFKKSIEMIISTPQAEAASSPASSVASSSCRRPDCGPEAAAAVEPTSASSTLPAAISGAGAPTLPADKTDATDQKQSFLAKLKSELALITAYEHPEAQRAARAVVPEERLRKEVADECGEDQTRFPDVMLGRLVQWFKEEFFSWFNCPTCDRCQKDMVISGKFVAATPDERRHGASQIEHFQCNACGAEERFARYHSDPSFLLVTRRGRCGEWANCFALILRSLGYDTRRVLDWTDHVWCEVYSPARRRWLHVDPCEALIDQPLVYEQGWGKRLSYIIAVSKDEVQDVSWRYSRQHEALKQRRHLVPEAWLRAVVLRLSSKLQQHYSEEKRNGLIERRLCELVELMCVPSRQTSDLEHQPRQSGSLAWRSARQELGSKEPFEWRLRPAEMEAACFHLEYDVVTDRYARVSDLGSSLQQWSSGIVESKNVFRKVEPDWKMAYLARTEGSDKAMIKWCLNMDDTNYSVKSIELLVESHVFKDGKVVWQLCGGSSCLLPLPGKVLQSEALAGSKKITLTAVLSGGIGECAWQHTQLFRSSTRTDNARGTSGCQLRLIVRLKCDDDFVLD